MNSLTPFETRSAFITMHTDSPSDNPVVNSGDVFRISCSIYVLAISKTPEDDLAT